MKQLGLGSLWNLGGLLSFMIRNAFLSTKSACLGKMQIEGPIHLRSHSIPLIFRFHIEEEEKWNKMYCITAEQNLFPFPLFNIHIWAIGRNKKWVKLKALHSPVTTQIDLPNACSNATHVIQQFYSDRNHKLTLTSILIATRSSISNQFLLMHFDESTIFSY